MKKDHKGRSKGGGRFLALHHYLMNSAAWRSLSTSDKAVYIALAAIYDGSNNGRLAFSVRRASDEAGMNKDTAAKSLKTLAERGFIERVKEGRFHLKIRHSAEWRLTAHRCDVTKHPGSRAFLKWAPGNSKHGPNSSDTSVRNFRTEMPITSSHGPASSDQKAGLAA